MATVSPKMVSGMIRRLHFASITKGHDTAFTVNMIPPTDGAGRGDLECGGSLARRGFIFLHPQQYLEFERSAIGFGRDGQAIFATGFPVLGPAANGPMINAQTAQPFFLAPS